MPVTREDFTPGVTSGNSITTTLDAGTYSLQQVTEGFKIPQYDYLSLTYVAAGDGAGEIETVTYKTGGASGQTVSVLTLGYTAEGLSTVTRTDS